eukprot:CAMPEP_0172471304 /NCGR_PEP_ID=MMETSP1065-20121228/67747_1 /TAXON_ID=265537 /ORGANISM="Amphiprora paludosa, Strain CCMP125" /LENGTH=867 /DNA_ID=CAMNT_0013229399 /DNA_START=273 /DNA_END=2877 /DNA_ORIENTATION=-
MFRNNKNESSKVSNGESRNWQNNCRRSFANSNPKSFRHELSDGVDDRQVDKEEERQEPSPEEQLDILMVHPFTCYSCGTTPIVGKGFHALNRPNYDLCASCHTDHDESKKDNNAGDEEPIVFEETPLRPEDVPLQQEQSHLLLKNNKSKRRDQATREIPGNKRALRPMFRNNKNASRIASNGNPKSPIWHCLGWLKPFCENKKHAADVDDGQVQKEEHREQESAAPEQQIGVLLVHPHHTCDSCGTTPIVGKRFHALNRPDYDICAPCHTDYGSNKKDNNAGDEEPIVFEEAPLRPEDVRLQQELLSQLSGFEKWKGHLGKTSLENQVQRAMELWDEAHNNPSNTTTTATTAAAFIKTLENTPILDANGEKKELVTWKGIHVGWFHNVFCKLPYIQKLIEEGAELWFVRKVGVNEIIRRTKPNDNVLSGPLIEHLDDVVMAWGLDLPNSEETLSQPTIADATTFVSYTGGYKLGFLVEMLDNIGDDEYIWMDVFCVDQLAWTGKGRLPEMKVFREELTDGLQAQIKKIGRDSPHAMLDNIGDDEYIWMDVFCVDQLAWTGKSRLPQMKVFREELTDGLQDQIKKIGRTALMLEKWNNVMRTLGQAWILWEIFNTAQAEVKMDVYLPQQEIEHYLRTCMESDSEFDSIQQSLSEINAQNAKAQDAADRDIIFSKMKEFGFFGVNSLVISQMRDWLIKVAKQRLSEKQEAKGQELYHFDFFKIQLASLLQDQGKLEEEGRREKLGDHHPHTLNSINNLAMLLQDQGKLEEAEPLLREALDGNREKLGDHHPDTLDSIYNLAAFLVKKERGIMTKEAEKLFREDLLGCQSLYGYRHANTLGSVNKLVRLLRQQGREAEATELEAAFADAS